jgi:hypothetical protein
MNHKRMCYISTLLSHLRMLINSCHSQQIVKTLRAALPLPLYPFPPYRSCRLTDTIDLMSEPEIQPLVPFIGCCS